MQSSKSGIKEYQNSLSSTNLNNTLPCSSPNLSPSQIYSICDDYNNSPVQKSKISDWSFVISEFFRFQSLNLSDACKELKENLYLSSNWDKSIYIDYPGILLRMLPMDWFKEQYLLIRQIDSSVTKQVKLGLERQLCQLSENFKWFLWAVGSYLYFSLTTAEKEIGHKFKELSQGAHIYLPTKLKKWLSGFVFKGVKFKLTFRHRDEGKVFRAEFKALKIFNLICGPLHDSFNYLVLSPLLMHMDIGPFSLYAVPVFFKDMLKEMKKVELENARFNFVINKENLYKVKNDEEKRADKDCVLVYNLNEVIQENKFIGYFLIIRSDSKVIEIRANHYFSEVPESLVRELLSENPENITTRTLKHSHKAMSGWDCYLYYEEIPNKLKRNEVASLFGTEIYGDTVISVHQVKKHYNRFPLFSISSEKLKKTIKKNVKDCIKMLKNNKNLSNSQTFKELLHRKGLRYYYLWIIYARCKDKHIRSLIECDLLSRAVNKIINSKFKKRFSIEKYKDCIINTINPLIFNADDKSVQLVYLALFFERLKCIEDYENFELGNKKQSAKRNFLYSSKILDKIISCGQKQPGQFLACLEYHCRVKFRETLVSAAMNDSYYFVCCPKLLQFNDVDGLGVSVHCYCSLREVLYVKFLGFIEKNVHYLQEVKGSAQETFKLLALEMILPCDLYSFSNFSIYKPVYALPPAQIIQDFLTNIDPILKDLRTITSEETFKCEILFLIISQLHSTEGTSKKVSEALETIDDIILNSILIPPELIIAENLWTAYCVQELNVPNSEQLYITSLLAMTRLMGDPRGRGNKGVPWQMLVSWKISEICKDSQRLTDAYLADEHFDSVFHSNFPNDFIPLNKEEFFNSLKISLDYWILKNSLIFYNSGKLWSKAYSQQVLQSSKIKNSFGSFCVSMSIASTSSSFKNEARRGLSQRSLTSVLGPETGALSLSEMKGFLYTWGKNQSGQLGLNNSSEYLNYILPFPRLVTSLKNYFIVEISTGAEHCIAISFEGIPFVWGDNSYSQLGIEGCEKILTPSALCGLPRIKSAACGYEHSLMLSDKGKVYSMGQGDGGALGHGNVKMQCKAKMIKTLRKNEIKFLDAGAYHSVAVCSMGKVFVWGRGEGGQLGITENEIKMMNKKLGIEGGFIFLHTPCQIFGQLSTKKVKKVACGEAHTLALTEDLQVYVWGWGSNGQLGTGSFHSNIEQGNKCCIEYEPIPLYLPHKISDIAAGSLFSMFLTKEKNILACGMNDFCQLGLENPKQEHLDVPQPTQLVCFVGCKVELIACGESHSVAVTETGKNRITWAWGRYKEGQLGVGSINSTTTPRPVQVLNNAQVVKVECGRAFTTALIGETKTKMPEKKKSRNKFAIHYLKDFY